MTVQEIHDVTTQLIAEGHGLELIHDDNDPHFAICGIVVNRRSGKVVMELDEAEALKEMK